MGGKRMGGRGWLNEARCGDIDWHSSASIMGGRGLLEETRWIQPGAPLDQVLGSPILGKGGG